MSGVQNKKSKPTRFTRLFCLNSLRETPSFTRLKIEENIKAKNKDEIQRPNLRRNTKEKIKKKYKGKKKTKYKGKNKDEIQRPARGVREYVSNVDGFGLCEVGSVKLADFFTKLGFRAGRRGNGKNER